MAWLPIANTVPQYVDANGDPYSGAVLKFYQDGTTTNTNMATDDTGVTQITSVALDSNGYPSNGGSVFIPHIDQEYKIALYPTQTAADADTGAIWTIDSLTAPIILGANTDEVAKVSSNDTTAGYLNGKLVAGTGVTLVEGSDGGNETLTVARDTATGIVIDESADHTASPTAGKGEFWVRSDTPNTPMFTDDAGTDFALIPEIATWTPTLVDTSFNDSESQTYAINTGIYYKSGRAVNFTCEIEMSSLGTLTTSAAAFINNLPFTPMSGHQWPCSVDATSGLAITAGHSVGAIITTSVARIQLKLSDVTTGTSSLLISEITASGKFRISGFFLTA